MLLTLGEKSTYYNRPDSARGRLATQLDRAGENGAAVSAQRPLRRRTQRPKRFEDYDLTSGGSRRLPADGGQRTVVQGDSRRGGAPAAPYGGAHWRCTGGALWRRAGGTLWRCTGGAHW